MVAYATRLSGLETAGRWFILFGDGMHRRLEDGGRGSAMSCVENDLYFDWSGHPGHVQSWTPLPKPAHFHFEVPTSHRQLLCSSVCHAAIDRPSAFKASAFVSSVVVLSSLANSSHKAQ